MDKVTIFEAFAGYGSQSLALKRLHRDFGLEYEAVGYSEIDKHACKAYDTLHPNVLNYGDVTTIDWTQVPDFDLLTWSSPCTNISTAGKQEGMTEDSGTASSFIWSIKDCLSVKRPKYILVENVANIVGKRFIGEFNKFQRLLESFGYLCQCKVMNAKDYGCPQNRKRLFLLARRSDMPVYYFPKPFKLEKRLKDVLETNVDERYYLGDKALEYIFGKATWKPKINGDIAATVACGDHSYRRTDNFIAEPVEQCVLGWSRDDKGNVVDRHPVEVANCVTAGKRDNTQNYVVESYIAAMRGRDPQCLTTKRTEYGKKIRKLYENGEVQEQRKNIQQLEPRTDGLSNTITTVAKDNLVVEQIPLNATADGLATTVTTAHHYSGNIVAPKRGQKEMGVMEIGKGVRIRRLSERELFRLMDVDEEDIDTLLSSGISKTQLAKLAGNSIVVACLYYIFKNLFVTTEATKQEQLTLF